MVISQELDILRSIISRYFDPDSHLVFIFGSRATGKSSKFSDVDIGIAGPPVDPIVMNNLMDEFVESETPYIVDIVDFYGLSDSFMNIALDEIIPLNFNGDADEVRRAVEESLIKAKAKFKEVLHIYREDVAIMVAEEAKDGFIEEVEKLIVAASNIVRINADT